ncbi:MAG: hypothetical protein L0J32_07330 [Brevibacterium sp.]|nr:hypothetical protein [Brevibacterium sp.]MDN6602820.1 hypothetical protein [Brevibacterium sp.]MDN6668223.1 hypothetical protein [Brevibacterium sp.]
MTNTLRRQHVGSSMSATVRLFRRGFGCTGLLSVHVVAPADFVLTITTIWY